MKNKTPYKSIGIRILFFGILLLISCEETIDWDLQTEKINSVVVDAQLTNELKFQHIHLTKPFEQQNSQVEAVSGANILVRTDNSQVIFIESPDHPGHYFSDWPAATSINKTYELIIQYEGKEYLAETYMIPVLPSQAPQWIYHADKGLYSIQWPAGPYSQNQQAMYEAVISWSHLVDSTYSDTLTYARIMYYTFNTIDVSYVIFPQDKEQVFFPGNSIAVVKKYSLTYEYASYLRALLAETEWQGSLFEEARGNLPTNISDGGLGYFCACSVISDTLVVGQ